MLDIVRSLLGALRATMRTHRALALENLALRNHPRDLVAADFFTVPTATFQVLFVCIILAHHRRRIVHLNVTANPTAAWTAQQVVDAFPADTAPRYLLRDRDRIYGPAFRRR